MTAKLVTLKDSADNNIYPQTLTSAVYTDNEKNLSTVINSSVLFDEIEDIDKVAPQFSNRNLLDNSWFSVNQRNATSYTNAGYTVDRWYWNPDSTGTINSITISDNGVTLETDMINDDGNLIQKFESSVGSYLDGKTCTLSIKLGNGSIHSGSATYTNDSEVVFIDNDYIKLMTRKSSGYPCVRIVLKSSPTTILAVKLELGTQSTLSMDSAPDYATELLKCQRYFLRMEGNNSVVGFGYAWSDTSALISIPIPVAFRTSPTVVYTSGVRLNDTKAVTAFGNPVVNSNVITISVTSSDMSSGTAYVVNLDSTGCVDLSADL